MLSTLSRNAPARLYDLCPMSRVPCLIDRNDYDTYANSGPRHAIQKSLTAALVALAPLRLWEYFSVRLGQSEAEMLT